VVRWTNLGSRTEPAFAEDAEEVLLGGTPLDLGSSYAMLTVADWDQDGRWDLVLGGSDGAVRWARNTGSANAPVFDRLRTLVEPVGSDDAPVGRSGHSVQVEVADLNGDGRVDLLVGDSEQSEPTRMPTEEDRARLEEISEELARSYSDLMEILSGGDEQAIDAIDPARMAAYRALFDEYRSLTPDFQFHGYVWLYARPPAKAAP